MRPDWEGWLAGVNRVWAPVATPVGFLLALGVTAHLLLTKRDVAACIGWVGLAWLAPVWGALLYVLFGVNRVVRRARQVRPPRPTHAHKIRLPDYDFANHLKPLEKALRHITQRPIADGNTVAVLRNGDEAFPAMLEAIGGARVSVALCTYIMRDDPLGRRFVDALSAARERGVEVKILLDGIGSGYFPPIYRVLRQHGLEVALFMHSVWPWRMPFLNLRNHKKLLVVDGSVAFSGGLNIMTESLMASRPRHPVADTHFRFEGPVAAQLMEAFARDWAFTVGQDLKGPAWFPDLADHGGCVARAISSGPDQDLEKIEMVLLEAIACAVTSIRVMTPYFLPGDQVLMALALAAIRGVDVEIVVPHRSNHRFVDLAMHAHIGPLLDRGVRVWYGPPPFDHSKLMVIDHVWSFIGSANWDMRSLRLNFELNVEVYDPELARQIEDFIRSRQDKRLRSRDLAARPLPVQLRDAALRLLLPYI